MSEQPRATPASGQQLATVLLIGGLSVASLACFAFAFGHSEFQGSQGAGDVWSRSAFLLAATGAIMTTVLSCNFWLRRRAHENHAETISGVAANHALLEQVSAKQDKLSDRFDELAEKIENQKWDIFGELAINAAGADVIPFPRRTNGHPEGH